MTTCRLWLHGAAAPVNATFDLGFDDLVAFLNRGGMVRAVIGGKPAVLNAAHIVAAFPQDAAS